MLFRSDVLGLGVSEGKATLVAVPLFVDMRVVPRKSAHDFVAAVIGAQVAAGCAVLTHRRRGHQVERTGAEPVVRAGERADRADLDGVAREVRVECFFIAGADLLLRTAVEQADERVAGDLVSKAGATRARDATLDRKSTRLNSSHVSESRMPSSA